jgi:hypothetical protein
MAIFWLSDERNRPNTPAAMLLQRAYSATVANWGNTGAAGDPRPTVLSAAGGKNSEG